MKKRTALNTIPVTPETAPKSETSGGVSDVFPPDEPIIEAAGAMRAYTVPITSIHSIRRAIKTHVIPVTEMQAKRRAVARSVLACVEQNEAPTDEEKHEIQGFFPEVELAAKEKSVGKQFWRIFLCELARTYPDLD